MTLTPIFSTALPRIQQLIDLIPDVFEVCARLAVRCARNRRRRTRVHRTELRTEQRANVTCRARGAERAARYRWDESARTMQRLHEEAAACG